MHAILGNGSIYSPSVTNSYGVRAYNFTAQYTTPLGFSDGLIVQVLNYKFYTGLILVLVVWVVAFVWMAIPIHHHKLTDLQNRTTSFMNMLNVFRLGPTIIRKEDIDGSPNLLERIKRKHKHRKDRDLTEKYGGTLPDPPAVKRMSIRIKGAAVIGSFFGILAVYSILVGLYLSGQYASSYHEYCDYTHEPPHSSDFVNIQRTTEVQPLFHFFEESPKMEREAHQRLRDNFLQHEVAYLLTLKNFTVNPMRNSTTLQACKNMASSLALMCSGGVRCRNISLVEKSASNTAHVCVVNVSTSISFAPRGKIVLSFPKLVTEDPSAESNFDSVNVTILTPAVVGNTPTTLFTSETVTLGQPCSPPPNDTFLDSHNPSSGSEISKRNLRVCEYTLEQHFIMTQYQDCNLMSTAYHDYSSDYFVTLSYVDVSEEFDNQTRFALHYTLYSDPNFVFNKQTKIISFNTVLVYSFIGAASIYGFVGLLASTMTTVVHYGFSLSVFALFVSIALAKQTLLLSCMLFGCQSRSEAQDCLKSVQKKVSCSSATLNGNAGSSMLVQSIDDDDESRGSISDDGGSADDDEDIVLW